MKLVAALQADLFIRESILKGYLAEYQQAKAAAIQFAPLYAYYSGRMAKDTDEVTVDKSFVADQDPMSLCTAVRRIIANTNADVRNSVQVFNPMIKKPVVSVEVKIVGILRHIDENRGSATLDELLSDSVSLPDMIAIFIGVLELVKVRKLIISEEDEDERGIHGIHTKFMLNENEDDIIKEENTETFE